MKKTFKKIAALLLAGAMAAACAVTASAAGTHKLGVTNPATDHVYTAYQVFTGDYAIDEEGKLTISNAKYGTNIASSFTVNSKSYNATPGADVPAELLEDLSKLSSATASDNAQATADVIEGMIDGTGTVVTSAVSLAEGYYFVKDTAAEDKTPTDTYSTYVAVNLYEDVNITLKKDTTTSEKKVDDKNDTTGAEDDVVWEDSADYDIGDKVPFQLKATIASDYADYTKGPYKLVFHDEQSAGLTFNKDAKVYVDGEQITSGFEVVTTGLTDGCTFEVRFANLKNINSVKGGSVITVEYTSTLNKDAEIGATGNPNKSKVTFTNDKNDEQGGDKGSTEWDTVIVFTFESDVNKVDTANQPLKGAGFTLYKEVKDNTIAGAKTGEAIANELKTGNASINTEALKADAYYVAIQTTTITNENTTTFEFKGIDDGTYVVVETTIPAGYNTAKSVEVTVTAEHDKEAAAPKLTKLEVDNTDFRADVNSGLINTNVINAQGSTLPSTGGMGTTIFYVIGGILVLAAAIILISRRRVQQ